MLLLDGQVHHDTHVIPMGNYVSEVGNYLSARPSDLGNYMSADMITHIDEGLDFLGWRIQRHRKRGTNQRYVYTYPSRKALRAVMAAA